MHFSSLKNQFLSVRRTLSPDCWDESALIDTKTSEREITTIIKSNVFHGSFKYVINPYPKILSTASAAKMYVKTPLPILKIFFKSASESCESIAKKIVLITMQRTIKSSNTFVPTILSKNS